MKKSKLSRAFLVSCLLVLGLALSSCVPDDDDGDDEDARENAPVVAQLT